MKGIVAPLPADTRSIIADWLELITFSSMQGQSSKAQLLGLRDLAEDRAVDPLLREEDETGETLDNAILEEDRQSWVTNVFEELGYRRACLGESYPFKIDTRRSVLMRTVDDPITHPGQTVYLFCLLASAIRERRLQPKQSLSSVEGRIADNFQICACLAAGGYIVGEVASFGFPRATGTAFLPALREAYQRFGIGQVRATDDIPPGLPTSLKDGGIDVIAWRALPDGMPGRIYLLGQCASGKNWKAKSVVEYISQFHGAWFTVTPAKYSLPAMFIPFPFHHDLEEPEQGSFTDFIRNRYWYEEQRFGIVFDRLRIAHYAHMCMTGSEEARRKVDGTSRFDEVRRWVERTIQIVRGQTEGVAA